MIDKLKRYEGTFKEVQQNFMRALTRAELKEIEDIVKPYGITLAKTSCSKCVFNFISEVAKLYFKEMAKAKEEAPKAAETPNKPKKKNGRTTKTSTGNDRSASE